MSARTLFTAAVLLLIVRPGNCQQVLADGSVHSSKGTPEQMRAASEVLNQADRYFREGQTKFAARNYVGAERLFRMALEAWDGEEGAQIGLAYTYERHGKKERAADTFRSLIFKKDPGSIAGDPTTLLNFALLLTEMRQWEDAAAIYERAMASPDLNLQRLPPITLHFRPDVWYIRKLQAAAHLVLGIESPHHLILTDDEKIAHLRQAVKLQPDMPLAHLYLGFGLNRAGRFAEAEACYKQAADLAVKEPEIRAAAQQRLDDLHYFRAIDAPRTSKPGR